MNIQTERLENHVARLTVEVEDKKWEQAKHKAARALSKKYRIPGFRKGKAPYKIVLRFIGEAPIMESAIENLGNEIYKDVLQEAEIDPYTSGAIEKFDLEPQPTYVFTVPLQPEVTLDEYHSIRIDYEAPEVSDEQVDESLQQLRQQHALVEDSDQPIVVNNRITVDIHSEFTDDAPEIAGSTEDTDDAPEVADSTEDTDDAEEVVDSVEDEDVEEETEATDDSNGEEKVIPQKGDNFAHQHDAVLNLDPEREPLLPGFIDAILGATIDEEREFELTVPENDDDYVDIGGRKVQFNITVKKVQVVTLSEINDDFAARVTEKDDEALTLLQLRVRTREELQEEANRQADDTYANKVLDAIVEQATVNFPDAMLNDRIHEMIHDFDNQLQQQGMNLETYQQVLGITHEQLHEQYHDDAVSGLERSLVLGEVITAEGVTLKDDEVEAEVEKTLSQFGEQADVFRQFFDTPQQRSNIASSLLYGRIMSRLAKIGKGESLEEEEIEEIPEVETSIEEATTELVSEITVEATEVEASTEEEAATETVSDGEETETEATEADDEEQSE